MLLCHSSYCTMCIIHPDLVSFTFYTIPISPLCNLKNFSFTCIIYIIYICDLHSVELKCRTAREAKTGGQGGASLYHFLIHFCVPSVVSSCFADGFSNFMGKSKTQIIFIHS